MEGRKQFGNLADQPRSNDGARWYLLWRWFPFLPILIRRSSYCGFRAETGLFVACELSGNAHRVHFNCLINCQTNGLCHGVTTVTTVSLVLGDKCGRLHSHVIVIKYLS